MAIVSSCREAFSFAKKNLGKRNYSIRKKLGKGVLLSQETNETHVISCNCPVRRIGTLMRLLVLNQRKEWTTVGQYGPNLLGLHRVSEHISLFARLAKAYKSRT